MAKPKKDDGAVCNLCGEKKHTAHARLQYPAFACNKCYRLWKRSRA